MRAYHFLRSEHALQALQNQRLKVATLNELNDPFELFAADLSEQNVRFAFRTWKNDLAKRTGILCFSRHWKNLLLWSHYADRHRGIALEFEIDDDVIVPIRYRRTRIRLDAPKIASTGDFSEDLAEKLFATKSHNWAYEEEIRVPTALSDCIIDDNRYFESLCDQLKIVGAVLGPLCEVTSMEIQRILPNGNSVKLYRSRMAFGSFNIVRNKAFPVERIRGTM